MSGLITIDGSFGEGGGQIVRTSLTLSALLRIPVRIENIRARRPKPGLGLQHLAAVRAAAKVCAAQVEGAKKGSRTLVFRPGEVRPGHYSREIGSAGSTTLVLQTVFPVLAAGDRSSTLTIYGGTHNPMAPPVEFLSECWLPALSGLGLTGSVSLIRHGFYPKGGGALKAEVHPWREPEGPLEILEEVEWGEPAVSILIANLPQHVAFREREELSKKLRLPEERIEIQPLPGEVGPGNAILIRYRAQGRTALITGFGEPGKRAERVAAEAAREAKNFARSKAPVDPRLADQLIAPMALGPGGRFATSEITEHLRTNAEVVRRFLGVEIKFESARPGLWVVSVEGSDRMPPGGRRGPS